LRVSATSISSDSSLHPSAPKPCSTRPAAQNPDTATTTTANTTRPYGRLKYCGIVVSPSEVAVWNRATSGYSSANAKVPARMPSRYNRPSTLPVANAATEVPGQ
jgi:hypothetical protein